VLDEIGGVADDAGDEDFSVRDWGQSTFSRSWWPSERRNSSLTPFSDHASAYLDQVQRRIMAAWKLPPNTHGLKIVICLRLERSGRVSDVRVEKSSGDKQFDASAVQAVRRARPFPVVPDSAKSSLVGDLRLVLDPTRSMPKQFPGKKFELSQGGCGDVDASSSLIVITDFNVPPVPLGI